MFPRICLYVADLPEERHILGLMLGRCHRLCSHCLAEQGDLGAAQLAACSRSVAATLAVQLEAALLFDKHTGTGRIKQIGAMHSATPFVPILASRTRCWRWSAVRQLLPGAFAGTIAHRE